VSDRVPKYVEQVASLLRAEGRAEDAGMLMKHLSAPARAKPAAFVAGEDKRGKSYLVNALLGDPQLSPVGTEVTTGAPITFFHAAKPSAMVFHYGEAQPKQTDVDEARRLSTVKGNPGNEHNVRAVAIGVAHPLLAKLNLVDTPGVGGLASGHGELTLQSLNSADALIFVLEAGAQIRAPELDFLERASERIDSVILVLSKIDAHRGWRTIADDNLRILREKAPRFLDAPIVPVSSFLALRARDEEDEEERQALREESGIAQLEQALTDHVVERASMLRSANVVRGALAAITSLDRRSREEWAALKPDGASRKALEDEQHRLQHLHREKVTWSQELDREIRKISLDRSEAATRGTLEIRRRYDERLKNVSKEEMETLPGEFIAEVTALAASLNQTAAERLLAVVKTLVRDLDATSSLHESIGELGRYSLQAELEAIPLGTREVTAADKMGLLSTFALGRSFASLLSGSLGITAGAALAPPVGLALGLGIGGWMALTAHKTRDRQAFQQEFRSWMQLQIAQAQLSINTSFQRRMIDVQRDIMQSLEKALTDREAEIRETLARTQELLQSESERLRETQSRLERRFQTLRAAEQQGRTLLNALEARRRPEEAGAPAGGPR
jgi:hypothetical protein